MRALFFIGLAAWCMGGSILAAEEKKLTEAEIKEVVVTYIRGKTKSEPGSYNLTVVRRKPDGWIAHISSIPAKPGAHSSLHISPTGKIEKSIGGM